MTTFLLVRHCAFDAIGEYIAGGRSGERLNALGRSQVEALRAGSAGLKVDAVFSSPLERARETAVAFEHCCPAGISIAEELTEVDFGDWTGASFEVLSVDP